MAYFIFGYLSTKLGPSVDGHEKIIIWKFHWNNGKRALLSKICITANIQENVILHYKTFYFGKTCSETWNFSLPKKLDTRKTKFFHDRPSSFCSTYPNICDRTKKMEYRSEHSSQSAHTLHYVRTHPGTISERNLISAKLARLCGDSRPHWVQTEKAEIPACLWPRGTSKRKLVSVVCSIMKLFMFTFNKNLCFAPQDTWSWLV
jgi:hypothetical protein